MKKVVKGADIYQKTTPEEWERFERVIHKNGPFDIVMDGLNVSYLGNLRNYTKSNASLGQQIPSQRQKPCSISVIDFASLNELLRFIQKLSLY